jgi:hypothetical protein
MTQTAWKRQAPVCQNAASFGWSLGAKAQLKRKLLHMQCVLYQLMVFPSVCAYVDTQIYNVDLVVAQRGISGHFESKLPSQFVATNMDQTWQGMQVHMLMPNNALSPSLHVCCFASRLFTTQTSVCLHTGCLTYIQRPSHVRCCILRLWTLHTLDACDI